MSIALLDSGGYAGTLVGLLLIGGGCAIANPAMAHAVMSAIPPEKAGMGAGVNGTLAEFGNGLGVAVLGAVLNSRVPSAGLAAGLETGQLVGAVAVLLGGVLAAALLRRAKRADSGMAVAQELGCSGRRAAAGLPWFLALTRRSPMSTRLRAPWVRLPPSIVISQRKSRKVRQW